MLNADENEERRLILHKKADAFCVLGVKVHLKLKGGFWKRGIIQEVGADFFVLDESKEGKQPIFFIELDDIEKFREKKEEENGQS